MNDEQLLARLDSMEDRLTNIEANTGTMNREIGAILEKIKPTIVPMLIKYVVFPLILVIGTLVGAKIVLPI